MKTVGRIPQMVANSCFANAKLEAYINLCLRHVHLNCQSSLCTCLCFCPFGFMHVYFRVPVDNMSCLAVCACAICFACRQIGAYVRSYSQTARICGRGRCEHHERCTSSKFWTCGRCRELIAYTACFRKACFVLLCLQVHAHDCGGNTKVFMRT